MKRCVQCGAEMQRRVREHPANFERRATCGAFCAKAQRRKYSDEFLLGHNRPRGEKVP